MRMWRLVLVSMAMLQGKSLRHRLKKRRRRQWRRLMNVQPLQPRRLPCARLFQLRMRQHLMDRRDPPSPAAAWIQSSGRDPHATLSLLSPRVLLLLSWLQLLLVSAVRRWCGWSTLASFAPPAWPRRSATSWRPRRRTSPTPACQLQPMWARRPRWARRVPHPTSRKGSSTCVHVHPLLSSPAAAASGLRPSRRRGRRTRPPRRRRPGARPRANSCAHRSAAPWPGRSRKETCLRRRRRRPPLRRLLLLLLRASGSSW